MASVIYGDSFVVGASDGFASFVLRLDVADAVAVTVSGLWGDGDRLSDAPQGQTPGRIGPPSPSTPTRPSP